MSTVEEFLSSEDAEEPIPETDVIPPPVDTTQWTVTDQGDARPQCQEIGCEKPCRKKRGTDGFLPYCTVHNSLHSGSAQTSRPSSQTPQMLEGQRKAKAAEVQKRIQGMLQPVQMGLLASGDKYCAVALGTEIPPIAQAIGELATEFPWLLNAVESVDKWSSLSLLTYHVVKLGCMIGVHHNWIPYEGAIRFLVPSPQTVYPPTPQETASANGSETVSPSFT